MPINTFSPNDIQLNASVIFNSNKSSSVGGLDIVESDSARFRFKLKLSSYCSSAKNDSCFALFKPRSSVGHTNYPQIFSV